MAKNESLLSQVKFEVDELDYSQLRANEGNKDAESGKTMYEGFTKTNFVINGKEIEQDHIRMLHKQVQNLYTNSSEKDYRPHLVEAFKKMFKHAEAEVPNEPIIQELITSCDKYESFVSTNVLLGSNLIVEGGHNKEININFINPKCVELKINTEGKYFIQGQSHDSDLLSLSSSLEFTLKPSNNKVEYTDGKLSLTVTPNSLGAKENQSLFSKVIAAIQELLEKIFGKEHVKMKEYKLEFNEPKSAINNPKADSIDKQEKSAS